MHIRKILIIASTLLAAGCSTPQEKKLDRWIGECLQGKGMACANVAFAGDTNSYGDYVRKHYPNYDGAELFERSVAFLGPECQQGSVGSCRWAAKTYETIGHFYSSRRGDEYRLTKSRWRDPVNGGRELSGRTALSEGYEADLEKAMYYRKAACDLGHAHSCQYYAKIRAEGPFEDQAVSHEAMLRARDLATVVCDEKGKMLDCSLAKRLREKYPESRLR